MYEVDSIFVRIQVDEGALDRLDAALNVCLHDEIESLDLSGRETSMDIFQSGSTSSGELVSPLPLLYYLPGGLLIWRHVERLAGVGRSAQAEHLCGLRRAGLLDRRSLIVKHRSHAASLLAECSLA